MDISQILEQLKANLDAIISLVSPVTDQQAAWKPSPDEWSILEVINHLYDEELEDFPARMRFLLEDQEGEWPSIDPQGWVKKRGYNERDPGVSLHQFRKARLDNLAWLEGLINPSWEKSYPAHFGSLSAGDLCAVWVAHDYLHLRQLIELKYRYHTRGMEPYRTLYAGEF